MLCLNLAEEASADRKHVAPVAPLSWAGIAKAAHEEGSVPGLKSAAEVLTIKMKQVSRNVCALRKM